MTDQANSGPPARWPLRDPRTEEQRDQDKERVRHQVAHLMKPSDEAGGTTPLDLIELMRTRQQTAPAGEANPFVSVNPGDGTTPSLVAENQLVIEVDDQDLTQLGGLLDGYDRADRTGRNPRRKTKVFRGRTPKTVDQLLDDARRIRGHAKKPMASLNPIVPLGYVIKGGDYPGLTDVTENFTAGTGAPVRVAIVDTGLTDQTRGDGWLTTVIRDGTDQLNIVAPTDRNDFCAGHGSFVAGIVQQIAPSCEIITYRFTGADGLGTDEAAADTLLKAADDGKNQRLIINASFGAPAVAGIPPLAIRDAVRDISTQYPDVLIIASAGNDGSTEKLYPAGFDEFGVKAVGALDSTLTGATFSNHGPWVTCSAVGVGVVSTFVEGLQPPEPGLGTDAPFPAQAWATWTGTSFTAPQISGAVAQLCSEDASLSPRAAFDQLILGEPTLPDFGTIVHILQGTHI